MQDMVNLDTSTWIRVRLVACNVEGCVCLCEMNIETKQALINLCDTFKSSD